MAGKPILGHILEGLKGLKIAQILIVVGSQSEQIIKFCKNYKYNFKFVIQKERLGLGHAVYLGSKGLVGPTLILLGDTITDFNFFEFSGKKNILGVKEVANPQRFGIVELEKDQVRSVVEKPTHPKSNLALVGVYYFSQIEKLHRAMEMVIKKGIKTKNEYQLTDGIALMIQRGEEFQVVKIKNWFDCSTPEALIETNRHLLKKNHHRSRQPKAKIITPVYIPESAEIINSIIGPYVSIGEGVKIKNSIIRDSIINNHTVIENAILENSIIGQHAVIRGSFKRLNVGESSILEFP